MVATCVHSSSVLCFTDKTLLLGTVCVYISGVVCTSLLHVAGKVILPYCHSRMPTGDSIYNSLPVTVHESNIRVNNTQGIE